MDTWVLHFRSVSCILWVFTGRTGAGVSLPYYYYTNSSIVVPVIVIQVIFSFMNPCLTETDPEFDIPSVYESRFFFGTLIDYNKIT